MPSPFDSIVYGPFQAAYHRALVDESFKSALRYFLSRALLPQVDHDFVETSGTLKASHDGDQYCGPLSQIRESFELTFEFRGVVEHSWVMGRVFYEPDSQHFPASTGRGLYLWTPSRQRKRQAEEAAIRSIANSVQDQATLEATCPRCATALSVLNASRLLSITCPNRCFNYLAHKNEENRPLHRPFVMYRPSDYD